MVISKTHRENMENIVEEEAQVNLAPHHHHRTGSKTSLLNLKASQINLHKMFNKMKEGRSSQLTSSNKSPKSSYKNTNHPNVIKQVKKSHLTQSVRGFTHMTS